MMQDGYTGLYWASYKGHLEVVRLLLDSRADPNAAKKVHGRTVPAAEPPHTHAAPSGCAPPSTAA